MKKNEQESMPEANQSLKSYSDVTVERLAKEALSGPSPSIGVEERILAVAHREAATMNTHSHPLRWGTIAAAASVLLALGTWQLTRTPNAPMHSHSPIDGVEAIVLFTQNGEDAQLADNEGLSREEQIQELAMRLLEFEGLEAPELFTLPEVEKSPEPHSTEIQWHRTLALQA